MKETETQSSENGQIFLYQDRDGKTEVEVSLRDETVWLSQRQMADLLSTERSVVTKHINNIMRSKELRKESVCAKFAHTAEDGKT